MKTTEIIQIVVISAALLGGVGVAVSKFAGSSSEVTVAVKVPELSMVARMGQRVYNSSCSSCHGEDGAGSKAGPPLVHDIYNPGHHGDESFYRAVTSGVKQHHWPYGNMPPRPEVSRRDTDSIIAYVRELQEANGIVYRAHRM